MARGAARIDSAILECAGKQHLVCGQSSRCLRRLCIRAGQEKSFARLTGIADKTDNAICAACAKASRGWNVGRDFAAAWPPVADDLLFAGFIVFEHEVELIFEKPGPKDSIVDYLKE